jgi:archaellum component FlaD/FlaE
MPAVTPATAQTPPAADPGPSDADLIKQIASEARSSGKSLTFNPDTGLDEADTDSADEPPARGSKGGKNKPAKEAKPTRGKDGKFRREKEPEQDTEETTEDTEETESDRDEEQNEADADAEDEEADEDADAEEKDDEEREPGVFDGSAIQAALDAEGGVDMLALAKALGKEPEELGVSPAQHKAIRLGQQKARATLVKAEKLAAKLNQQFGDPVRARKAVQTGELQPAIDYIQNVFGMSWNELNRAVAAALSGKPLPDLEEKREQFELKKRERERTEAEKKANEEKATAERTEKAKAFITSKIKADKLAKPEVSKLLTEAGLPSVVDMVFAELQAGYKRGLTDPKQALEKVRPRLMKLVKALTAAGLVALPTKPKPKPATTGTRPRSSAQAGAAGNSREMTDEELRRSVLKEAGLLR